MTDHIPIDDAAIADLASQGPTQTTVPDVAYQRLGIVNVVYVGDPAAGDWVLVDAGIPGSAGFIRRAVEQRFGERSRPAAIVLTHGHFDHVGALESLASEWDVPIYAHTNELPYLNGSTPYPPPDPSVGGGMMALLSRFYPRGPIDVSPWLRPLPADGTVPSMPGWRWLPTPGHTTGQIALWREADRTLLAADAFITTDQESAYSVATQKLEIQGPPMYFTPDWASAKRSVHLLAGLEPEVAVTGHGHAIQGEELRQGLHQLDEQFDQIAVPEQGRYVPDSS
jgi:glyoxylase-like metal-dependent hydrolase (beta-lactamase superfamily II)